MKLRDLKPNKILVRGVNWLGDAIMTTPALQRLRETYPKAHIALLTKEHLADIWQGHSAIDEVIPIGRKEGIMPLARRLRPLKFDLGIALPNSFRTGLELKLAKIPHRLGYTGRGRWFTLNHRIPHRRDVYRMRKLTPREIRAAIRSGKPAQEPIPTSAHHVHHYLNLLSHLGVSAEPCAPSIDVSPETATQAISDFGVPSGHQRPIIGINAGAEYGAAKRWPPDRFVSAILSLHRRLNCHIILFGGPGDLSTSTKIARGLLEFTHDDPTIAGVSLFDLAGKTSLIELAALLQNCHLLISNDTGPTHLAAAVGTPVVVPFGSTSPELTGPGKPASNRHSFIKTEFPCAPCFRRDCPVDFRCMKEIKPEHIVAEAVNQLQENDELLFQ